MLCCTRRRSRKSDVPADQSLGRCAHTPHGDVPTPVLMSVGTQATVKTLTPDELEAIGVPIVPAKTYCLYLRTGAEVVARLGSLHIAFRCLLVYDTASKVKPVT
jgi:tRNA-guanine family transglycosylase